VTQATYDSEREPITVMYPCANRSRFYEMKLAHEEDAVTQ